MTQRTAPTTPTRVVTGPTPTCAARWVLRRWATWLALGLAAFTLSDVGNGTEFAFVLVIAAVGYLAVAALGRPRMTWPLVGASLGSVVAMRVVGVDERVVVVAAGLAVLVAGLAGGSLRRSSAALAQVPAAALFVVAGTVGATVSGLLSVWLTPDLWGRTAPLGGCRHARTPSEGVP